MPDAPSWPFWPSSYPGRKWGAALRLSPVPNLLRTGAKCAPVSRPPHKSFFGTPLPGPQPSEPRPRPNRGRWVYEEANPSECESPAGRRPPPQRFIQWAATAAVGIVVPKPPNLLGCAGAQAQALRAFATLPSGGGLGLCCPVFAGRSLGLSTFLRCYSSLFRPSRTPPPLAAPPVGAPSRMQQWLPGVFLASAALLRALYAAGPWPAVAQSSWRYLPGGG